MPHGMNPFAATRNQGPDFLDPAAIGLEVLPRRAPRVERRVIVLASATRRLLAGLLDASFVLAASVGLWWLGVGGVAALVPPDGAWAFLPEHLADLYNASGALLLRPLVVPLAVASLGLGAVAVLTDGRSPGKLVLRLRVVGTDGLPATAPRLLVRALGYLVSGGLLAGLGWALAALMPTRRALHDVLAGTYVAHEGRR